MKGVLAEGEKTQAKEITIYIKNEMKKQLARKVTHERIVSASYKVYSGGYNISLT